MLHRLSVDKGSDTGTGKNRRIRCLLYRPYHRSVAPGSSWPFTSLEFQSKGDAFADLYEDLAAEQKARTVYENLLRVIDDPDVRAPLKFLRAREVVHFQRFGEALEMTKSKLDSNNFYYFNAEFDKKMFDCKK